MNKSLEKVKMLLVMPQESYSWEDWSVLPIGILYVSSSLKKAGVEVHTLNLNLVEDSIETTLKNIIEKENINVVGVGDLVVNHRSVKNIIDKVKHINNDIITIIGGNFVTKSPIEAMEIVETADFGIIGEGEITTYELIEAIEGKRELEEVKGLIIRTENNKLYMTEEREVINNLDEIPWPDYEGFKYFELAKKIKPDTVCALLTTSRSCPFSCTFCSKSGENKYRQRSLNLVFEELEYLVNTYGVSQFFLNDELFAHEPERILEFCEKVIKYNVQWLCFLRVSKFLTLEILEKMKQSGCIAIFYGIESGCNKILRSMRKGITVEEIERVLEITKKAGIASKGNVILGDVEEDKDTIKESVEWVKKIGERFGVKIFIDSIKLYPGSQLYEDAVKNGKIANTKQFILEGCPATNVSKLTDEEYKKLLASLSNLNTSRETYAGYEKAYLVESKKDKYVYNYLCSDCKHENTVEALARLVSIGRCEVVCENCGKPSHIHLFSQYTGFVNNKIEELNKNNNLGVFYKGGFWRPLIRFSDALSKAEKLRIIIEEKELENVTFEENIEVCTIKELKNRNKAIYLLYDYSDRTKVYELAESNPNIVPINFFEIGMTK